MDRREGQRFGFTLVELLVVIAIIGILVALLLPAIQAARESARRAQCTSNMKNAALAVHTYHDAKKEFPAAFRYPPSPPDNSNYHPLDDARLFWNWAIDVLPYLEEQPLHDSFVLHSMSTLRLPVNSGPRGAELAVMLCPSDEGRGNLFQGSGGNWARGNYGYNAFQFWPNQWGWKGLLGLDSTKPDLPKFYDFNIGMGGFDDTVNRMVLDFAKLTDGTSKTIMLAELRVGLSERDRRGVWAMGMCGSNYHCRHAAYSINDCTPGIDDVYEFQKVIDDVGTARLEAECMSVYSTNNSGQSTVRSRHPGGANCALADASVRFISDFIDQGAISGDGLIDDTPFDETAADVFGTWQRLNVSRDGHAIDKAF